MRGLALEADADARMNQNIMSGLLSVGQGVQRGAANRESKRRFGLQNERADRADARAQESHDETIARSVAEKEWAASLVEPAIAKAIQGQPLNEQDQQTIKVATSAHGGSGEATLAGVVQRNVDKAERARQAACGPGG